MPRATCYIIGTADPGTAEPNTMFFTREELHALVESGVLKNILVWFEHGDQWQDCVGRVVYAWVDAVQGHKQENEYQERDL